MSNIEEEISLREIIDTLLKGKWIIASITIAAVLVSGVLSFFVIEPTYKAASSIMVNNKQINNKEVSDGVLSDMMRSLSEYPSMTMETYRTQIKNPEVLKNVINKLELKDTTVQDLKNSIKIESIEKTNVLNISMEGKDPEKIQLIVNTVADEFTKFISKTNKELMNKSAAILKEKMLEQENKLNIEVAELKEFQKQPRGVSELSSELNARLDLLTDYKTELEEINIELAKKSAALQQAEAELSSTPKVITVKENIINDNLKLKTAEQYDSPNISELSNIEFNKEEINPLYIELNTMISNLKIEIADIKQQKQYIKELIEKNTRLVEQLQSELVEKEIQENKLKDKVDNAKRTYELFAQKYEEVLIAESAKVGENNIIVLSQAELPEKPIAPKKALNMAIALVFGGMVGVFIVFFREYWKQTSKENTVSG